MTIATEPQVGDLYYLSLKGHHMRFFKKDDNGEYVFMRFLESHKIGYRIQGGELSHETIPDSLLVVSVDMPPVIEQKRTSMAARYSHSQKLEPDWTEEEREFASLIQRLDAESSQ
jgi:hypothetical protein